MQDVLQNIRSTRRFLLELIAPFTTAQLNAAPTGFNNNIVWNLGHLTVALQGLCYRRSGLPIQVSPEFFDVYKPGSCPVRDCSAAEIEEIKSLLLSSIDQLETDYKNGLFRNSNYETFSRYGVTIQSIEAAIAFLPYHEGMHTGYIMALRRLV